MKILTIDTSTNVCSVALTNGATLVSECLVNTDARQSTRIMDVINTVMQNGGMTIDELDCLGVALGPGSFTGVRIGVATVKSLALASGKPVAGFSSLAMLAMNLPHVSLPVCPMFDARKKEVYAALYTWNDGVRPVIADCVSPPAGFLKQLSGPVIFIGEGAVTYKDMIVDHLGDKAFFAPLPCNQPSAARGAFLAASKFARGETVPVHAVAPVYIRPSEAELAKNKKNALK